MTQSGLDDSNFNTRGFNSSLNRRVAVLIDGRDVSTPFLGSQEWAAISFGLDDLEGIELVRGPSAALYGANASSGVMNIRTKSVRDIEGGAIRLSGGELDTFNAEVRYAQKLGENWSVKLAGGLRMSGDYTQSRNEGVEYTVACGGDVAPPNCLPVEAVPLAREDNNDIQFGGVRVDGYLGDSAVLTLEGGLAVLRGPTLQTGIGRVQVKKASRPWGRANLSLDHFNFRTTRCDSPTTRRSRSPTPPSFSCKPTSRPRRISLLFRPASAPHWRSTAGSG